MLIYQNSTYTRGAGISLLCFVYCPAIRWIFQCIKIWFQALVWNTWGPIESGTQFAFQWSSSTVAMFVNWGTIMFLITVVPLSKMIEVGESGCQLCTTVHVLDFGSGQSETHSTSCFWSHGIGDSSQMRKKVHQSAIPRKCQPDNVYHQVSSACRLGST